MKNRLIHSIVLGLLFCIIQSFGESIVGFIITDSRGISNVNFEGAFLFGIIRIFMTIVPYIVGFIILDILTGHKLEPSYISLGINLIVLIFIYNSGMIQEDPIAFIVGSIITGFILILINQQVDFRGYIQGKKV